MRQLIILAPISNPFQKCPSGPAEARKKSPSPSFVRIHHARFDDDELKDDGLLEAENSPVE